MNEYQEYRDWLQEPAPVTGYGFEGKTIPPAPGNRDYQQMLAEVEAGEAVILPAVKPPPDQSPSVVYGDVVASRKYIVVDEDGTEIDVTQALKDLARRTV